MRHENGRGVGRRGNIMVIGLSFGVLLGFSALSVDIGLVRLADAQHQASIDAAALSASSELDGKLTGIAAARSRAISVAGMNRVLDTSVTLVSADIQFGTWDGTTWSLYTGGSADTVNAVRISDTPPQVGSVLGAAAFGIAGYTIESRAMATRPLGGSAFESPCFLPFAVPDCHVANTPPGTNPPPFKFAFNPAPTDSIAYATLSSPASATSIQTQMSNGCTNGDLGVGSNVYPNNGMIMPAVNLVASILNHGTAVPTSTWDASLYGPIPSGLQRNGGMDTANPPWPLGSAVLNTNYGTTWEGPVALVDGGNDCANVTFNAQPMVVTGIAWGAVFDVKTTNPRNIYMQLDLINEHVVWGEEDEDGTGNVLSKGESTLTNW